MISNFRVGDRVRRRISTANGCLKEDGIYTVVKLHENGNVYVDRCERGCSCTNGHWDQYNFELEEREKPITKTEMVSAKALATIEELKQFLKDRM